MLPGYPDGSYGYAQVDWYLGPRPVPRLYVEYVGQGDSDKPGRFRYSSIERADLIEAQWRAHGISRTMVVSFDYSSLALLELLRRQRERDAAGEDPGATIDAVFIVNGGLFADSHSHPWDTTPMLKTLVGRVAMWFGQHVPGVFEATLRRAKLFSPSYKVSAAELADLSNAILRRDGAAFLHVARALMTIAPALRDRIVPLAAGWYAGEHPRDTCYGTPCDSPATPAASTSRPPG